MSRTVLSLLLTGLVVLVGASFCHAQNAFARLVISLSEGARLLVDGKPTRETGPSRTFVWPPLELGVNSTYELTFEVVRGS
jgi:uncharacterized protein (TIGR03000 family)